MKDMVEMLIMGMCAFGVGMYMLAWIVFGTGFEHMGVIP
jgi:hypothetical protein